MDHKNPALKSYSEKEVVETIQSVARKLANKFRFGHYTTEDMQQEAAIFGLEALDRFDPSISSLGAYLWAHIHNRLFNFKRDNFQRPDKPNEAKLKAMYPKDIANVSEEYQVDGFQDGDLKLDIKRLKGEIEDKLSIRLRPVWIRLVNGIPVKKAEKEKLLAEIHKILAEKNINIAEWEE